jgi:hypothetical protein
MRIGLFVPCYIDAFLPKVGIATLELLGPTQPDLLRPATAHRACARFPSCQLRAAGNPTH